MPRGVAAVPELDDCSLQEIFNRVGDARQLAKCSMVCKKWREVCYSVSGLSFNLNSNTKEAMWAQENTIAAILRRGKTRAPGCLKELQVSLSCQNAYKCKASAHWLASSGSPFTRLTLSIHGQGASWGNSLWRYLVNLEHPTLQSLVIAGRFKYRGGDIRGCSLPRLKHCRITSPIPIDLIEGLLAACPVLELLSVRVDMKQLKPLTVSTASLKSFELSCGWSCLPQAAGRFEILLQHVPCLSSLAVRCPEDAAIRAVHSMERLTELSLEGFFTLDTVFGNVSKVTLEGPWNYVASQATEVCRTLNHTPGIRTLVLRGFSGFRISSFLASLQRLEHLHIDSSFLLCLDSGLKLEGLTVHFEVHNGKVWYEYKALVNLLSLCGIQMLVVEHKMEFRESQLLQDLSALRSLYPGRVLFKHIVDPSAGSSEHSFD